MADRPGGARTTNRARLFFRTDLALLAAAIVVFATGLVLLTHFHVGRGAFRGSAAGCSRLVWVNLHRLASVVVLAGVAAHVALHWRAMVARITRVFSSLPGRATGTDLVLYAGFTVTIAAAFAAWVGAPGAPPLFGPVRLGWIDPARHRLIDLHFIAALAVLPAAIVHVRRHAGWLWRMSALPSWKERHGNQ